MLGTPQLGLLLVRLVALLVVVTVATCCVE